MRWKWKTYGRTYYYFELFVYLLFLALFTAYGIFISHPVVKKSKEMQNQLFSICNIDRTIEVTRFTENPSGIPITLEISIVIITVIGLLKELLQLIRVRYNHIYIHSR